MLKAPASTRFVGLLLTSIAEPQFATWSESEHPLAPNKISTLSYRELHVYPSSGSFDVAGHSSHVGQKSRTRKDNGVVANAAREYKEECVQIEV